ncbi:MAG: PH domain-containing protein [Chloroflexi bacterium]|nr:PH domain-containing protein [Chloroflexota bacterium]
MSLDKYKSSITGRIWQAIAQSGVNVSCIPQERLATLVNIITENVLVEVNQLLEEIRPESEQQGTPDPATTTSGEEEQILWEGRPFLSLSESYMVTTQRIRIAHGMVNKSREDIELIRIQDIDHTQHLGERIMSVGDVILRSSDPSDPKIILNNVSNPEQVHEIIRKAMLEARKRYGIRYRQDI